MQNAETLSPTNCAVVLIHHAGKDDSKGARGHSSLEASTHPDENQDRQ